MTLHAPTLRRTAASSLSAVLGGLLAGEAWPQTCATPLPIIDTPEPQYFDTCQASNSLPILGGFFPSPHNDAVTSFVISPGMSGTIGVTANFAAAVMLMQSPCGPDTPLQFAEMTPTSVALGNLPTGNYFMVLTGEPKTPGTGCGIAVVFSNAVYSDVIFTNGFQ